MELDRRDFLKLAGVTSASLGSLSSFLQNASAATEVAQSGGVLAQGQWIASCCNMCGGQTGIMCQVLDGRVVRIKPNDHNPNGFSNISDDFFANAATEGAVMCPKGNAGIMALYDPDRLKQPLRRTNPSKGIGVDPQWKAISWDEAYDEIVSKLKSLRDAGEAHKLLWFSEDHCF